MKNLRTSLAGQMVIGASIIIALLLGYYFLATAKDGTAQEEPKIEVLETDHVRGNPGAKVTLVEFGDFECPACAYYEPLVKEVLEKYPTDVRLVFRNFPLYQIHRNAVLAASYAEAASLQGKFWEFHDLLYGGQDEWKGSLTAEDTFKKYGESLGLDVAKLSNDAKSDAVKSVVEAHYKEGARLGVQGTPTFFVNGTKIASETLMTEIDKAVEASKAE